MTVNSVAQNPVISSIYTPDPAPYVHGDRVYLFVDHDEDDATYFLMKDWLVFSTEDMVNWQYLGAQVNTATFKWAKQGDRAWAAQAVEHNGKWYWYLCCNTNDGKDALCVAVADSPTGPWRDAIGAPLATGFGFIDPTVFIDDDGKPYLFWGNKGFWYGELNDDMISFKDGYKEVPGYTDPKSFGALQSKMDWSIGKKREMTQYEEGPWVTKRNGIYYAVYPAGGVPEYMAYSTAPSIHGPWTFKGRIMNEAENSFTIHGGNIHFKGKDYMFYHNGALPNGSGFKRATAIEEFKFNADGTIPFIPFTKEGVKPVGNLNPYKTVEAETMSQSWGVKLDRLAGVRHYVTSIHNGDWTKVRSVDFGTDAPKEIMAEVLNVKNHGIMEFYADALSGKPFARIKVDGSNTLLSLPIDKAPTGIHDVYILFRGGDEQLFDFDWWKLGRGEKKEIVADIDFGNVKTGLKNLASIKKEGEKKVLNLGKANGFYDMTQEMGRTLQSLSDYTFSVKYKVASANKLNGYGHFVFACSALAENSAQEGPYIAFRLNEQRFEVSAGGYCNEQFIMQGKAPERDVWHHAVYRQKGHKGELYIDGKLIGTNSNMPFPIDIFKEEPANCWIGRAPFKGDKYLTNTRVSDFRIYNYAISDDEMKELNR